MAAYGPLQRVMELSLVLASQNIQAMVVPTADRDLAELRVADKDEDAALEQLRAYHRENRHRRWQHTLPGHTVLFDAQSLTWAALVMVCYFFQTHGVVPFRAQGVFDSEWVRTGEIWRAVTALFLHADLGHLISNLTTGIVFLGIAMAEYGTGSALLASTAAGAFANLAALLFRTTPYHGLGASGMVLAALGLIAVRTFRIGDWARSRELTMARGLLASLFLFILHGFNPASDVLVHGLGFGFGIILGLALQPVAESRARQASWDRIGKAVFLILFAGSWYAALHPKGAY